MFSLHSLFIKSISKKFEKSLVKYQIIWAIFLTCELEKIEKYHLTNWLINYVYNHNRFYHKTEKEFLTFLCKYNEDSLKELIILLKNSKWRAAEYPLQKKIASIFIPFDKFFFENFSAFNIFKTIYKFLFGRVTYIWVYYYSWYNYIFYYKKNFTLHEVRTLPILSSVKYYLYLFYNLTKNIILPIIVSLIFTIILFDYFSINFLKQIAVWTVVGLLFFWLMSGFNFFLKRYRFGKFTASIQRFWKRTNSYFWLIEGFLFILFFYYYLNSSQEVLYMFDESNLNQTFLLSPKIFYTNLILLILLITYSYYILHNLVNYTYKQLLTHLTIVTLGIIYIFLLECYQFYYVLTFFFENIWSFDEENVLWTLNTDTPKIRLKQQYFLLALIAKYWHFLFIFFSWLFLVIKSYEQKRIYYNLFSLNVQNLMLLLLLNTLFITNWIKWLLRRFYDISYYWFFTDYSNWTLYFYFSELQLFLNTVLN